MKLKRITATLFCSLLLLSNTFIAGATEITNEAQVEIPVTATIQSTFTVSLPSNLQLTSDGSQYTYSTTVGVKGDIDVNSNIMVIPNESVTLHDVTNRLENMDSYDGYEHKDPVNATVSQPETVWTYAILSSGASSGNFTYDSDSQCYNTNLTITSPDLFAGDWEGTLTYNISLAQVSTATGEAPGLYDADDNLLATWEDSGIDISKNYNSGNYSLSETSGYYALRNNYPTATKFIIPDSVTNIGSCALYGCSGLTSVTIPDSVTSIGSSAFYACSSLTSVTIPNRVTSIGNDAFKECSGLTSVTILDGVTSIGRAAFYNCKGLTLVTIPDSVTGIGDSTFSGCSGLTSITIPNSVTSIGNNAFNGCKSLTSVTIPDSVTSIGEYAFDDCKSLTEIVVDENNQNYKSIDSVLFNKDATTLIKCPGGKSGDYRIPDSVTSIVEYAFNRCSSLTSVTIPNSVTNIGGNVFNECLGLTSITIPDSVTSIGGYAFNECSGLTSITIPDSVTSIGNAAFRYCSGLTSVTIPNSVTSIGYNAFQNCSSLTSVTIPDGVTSISTYIFSDCSSLTSVTIPDSVTSIGDNAFDGCTGLTSVTIPDSVTDIGYDAFYDVPHIYYNGSAEGSPWGAQEIN